jgi:hypothetical protein
VLHLWHRSTTGDWYGLVSYSIMYANRNPSTASSWKISSCRPTPSAPGPTAPADDDNLRISVETCERLSWTTENGDDQQRCLSRRC